MSSPESEGVDRDRGALARLDDAVDAVLERVERMEERLREAEERRRELESLLERFRTGEEDPDEMARRTERLARENESLRDRLEEGRGIVERIRARIRFLEERG